MRDPLTLEISSHVDCLCDFTYNFHWQHNGSELDPINLIGDSGCTYRDLVDHLKAGKDVHIRGDAGSRLASSLGVDLKYFGGTGGAVEVGNIFIDGNVGTRMGISMLSGRIYVSGEVSTPMGNVVEVVSDRDSYRCFRSITDIIHNGMEDTLSDDRNSYSDHEVPVLELADGIIRDTVGARCGREAKVRIGGDVSLSTGILMQRGLVEVEGNAGMNTGVLLSGGTVVVRGSTGEFAAADMRGGNLIIKGKTQGYMCANIRGGAVYVRADAKTIPPAKKCQPDPEDLKMLVEVLGTSRLEAMSYRKYSIC